MRLKRNERPILLNLPTRLIVAVDIAVKEQGIDRSQFLRQSVERNLDRYKRFERLLILRKRLANYR